MRSYDPNDKYDVENLARLAPPAWMVEQLALNPDYTCWGVGEDYMQTARPGEHGGWGASIVQPTWTASPFALDELNEVVNFHFGIERTSAPCTACDETGTSPFAKAQRDTMMGDYDHFTRKWSGWTSRLEGADILALVLDGRLRGPYNTFDDETKAWKLTGKPLPTSAEMADYFHDSINTHVMIKARCERAGEPHECAACEGHGDTYLPENQARLVLTLWVLHPRKGVSRGVEIQSIQREELPAVYAYLREAARRNAERFGKVPGEVAP